MKISCDWLKQYIDITVSPPKLAEKLTSVGLEVGGLEKHGNDTVFEIEITSNRPDWLSLFGIAREIAAVSGIRDIIIPKALPTKAKASMKKPFSIEIQDKDACARYVGRLIRDVVIAPSPLWMQTSLEAVGSRAINNGADITNYCMYETGQPMHAFDFDKLEGGQVIVRRAKKGETIITIDGVKRELDPSILVIADAKKPVAIAGIMGGQETEVTVQTKNILLESAYFDPVIIRRASRKLGLSTESNYRFERKVDIENVLFSSCRAAYLYKELCNGNVDEPFLDACYAKKEIVQLQLSVSTLERLSGMSVPLTKIKSILQSLGFDVIAGKTGINVTVPSFRSDVNIEEDLVEEVARIAGYDTIEEIMPPIKAMLNRPARRSILQKKTAGTAAGAGSARGDYLFIAEPAESG
jgi:Phenylalanyl-tRNA synthetase beta subunit